MKIVKKNSITSAAAVLILFLIGIVILSYPQLHFTVYAGGTTSCIDYDRTENTITISCDHASFGDVANTINDQSVLTNLGDNGEYLLNANLQVDDDATLSMDSSDDVKWLKIAGANGIIVNGRIEIDGVK